jgi:hypothetical protein
MPAVSEQWTNGYRAETNFWTGSQTSEDSGETLNPQLPDGFEYLHSIRN